MKRMKAELLAPAGSLAMLKSAIAFGADAVYGGQPRYSLRVRNNEFSALSRLQAAIDSAHAAGKMFYLVSNIYPHNAKLNTFLRDMAAVVALQPDALIVSDPGVLDLIKSEWPDMPLHLSVQANTLNWASVRFWQKLGVSRVILSRELSLDEIEEIRQRCPEMELEVFIHGALCIAYSGRCLMSGYFNHRDANQGSCTNACRWQYRMASAPKEGDQGRADRDYFVEEQNRPGEWMPIEEDEHGSYLFNSRDLRALEHIARLQAIGVDSLKIEGRTKSPYYVARTSQVYRLAIDAAVKGEQLSPHWFSQLENLANRGYTDGFFQRHHDVDYQNYLQGHSQARRSQYVADALEYDEVRGLLHLAVKNRFSVGDTLEFVHPQGNAEWRVERMEDEKGCAVHTAAGIGHHVWLPVPRAYSGAFVARYLTPANVNTAEHNHG